MATILLAYGMRMPESPLVLQMGNMLQGVPLSEAMVLNPKSAV
jgi:hypothetical protein